MSELCINFAYDDNVKREINQLTRKLDSRIDDYRGVRNSIAGINSNTGNLYNANTYLDKKRGKLEEKTRKLERFKRALTDFNSHAESVDKEVANEIKASTKAFCREHGLGYGVFYTLGVWIGDGVKWLKNGAEKVVSSVVNWAKDKLEEIKDFYERNKYLIEFVVDLVVTAAAIITFAAALSATIISGGAGIPLLLAATWGLMKAGASTLYSGAALSAHNSGDDALAEELSGKGMKDVMQYWLGDTAGSLLYHGLNIAAFAVSAASTVKDVVKIESYSNMLTPETMSGIRSSEIIKITTGIDVGGGMKTNVKNISKILDVGTKFASKGLAGMFGIGILKDLSGLVKDFTSIFAPSKAASLPY